MEGLKIINCLLSENKIEDLLLLATKNHISPVLHITSKQSISENSQKKFYEFSCKLIGCCVSVIEKRSPKEVKIASDIACLGLTAIEVLLNFQCKDIGIEKVLSAMLHCFLQLSKRNMSNEFLLFGKRFVSLCECYVDIHPASKSCINGLAKKAYQLHYKMATSLSRLNSEEYDTSITLLQLQGVLIYLYCDNQVNDVMDCFYSTLVFINDKSRVMDLSIANVVDSIICRLEFSYSSITDSKDVIYFETLLAELFNLLRKITIIDFDLSISLSKCPNLSKCLQYPLLLNKSFETMKAYVLQKSNFLVGDSLESFIRYKNIINMFTLSLCENDEATTSGCIAYLIDSIGDVFGKNFLHCYGCMETLWKYLNCTNNIILSYIKYLDETSKLGNDKRTINKKRRIDGVLYQRSIIVSWLILSFQNSMVNPSKQLFCKKCKKTTKKSCIFNELIQCLKDLSPIISSKYVSSNKANYIRSYVDSLAITFYKKGEYKDAATLVNLGIKYALIHNGLADNKINLIVKYQMLGDCHMRIHNFEEALNAAASNISQSVTDGLPTDMIVAQVDTWCNTKQKMIAANQRNSSNRTLFSSIDVKNDDVMCLVLQAELAGYKSICTNGSLDVEIESVCQHLINIHAQNDNTHGLVLGMIEIASLPGNAEERGEIFLKIFKLIDKKMKNMKSSKDSMDMNVFNDIKALSHFKYGMVMYHSACRESYDGDTLLRKETDFNIQFSLALEIWWDLYENIKFNPDDSVCRNAVQESLFTLSRLMILFDKDLAAIKSLRIHQHISFIKKPPEIPKKEPSVLCKAMNIATKWGMYCEARNIADKLEKMMNYDLSKNEVNEIMISLAYFRIQFCEALLAKDLIDQTIETISQERQTHFTLFFHASALLVRYRIELHQWNLKGKENIDPCQTLKAALKFFDSLMRTMFQADNQAESFYSHSILKEDTVLQSGDGLLAIRVVEQYLECLTLLAYEYRRQGLVTESRFDLEQGMIVCKQFKLYYRLASFSVENMEIQNYSNASKFLETFEEVRSYGFFQECIDMNNTVSFHKADDFKSLYFCLSGFKYNIIAKTIDQVDSKHSLLDNISKLSLSLCDDINTMCCKIKDHFLILNKSERKVEFIDEKTDKKKKKQAKNNIGLCEKESVDDIVCFLTCETIVQTSKLISRIHQTTNTETTLVIIKKHIKNIKSSYNYHLFKHHYRKALLSLYTWLTMAVVSSTEFNTDNKCQWRVTNSVKEMNVVEQKEVAPSKKVPEKKGRRKVIDTANDGSTDDAMESSKPSKRVTTRGKTVGKTARKAKTKKADIGQDAASDTVATKLPEIELDEVSPCVAQESFLEACSYLTCYDYLERKELSQIGVLLNGCKNSTNTTSYITHYFLQSNCQKLLNTYGKQMSDDPVLEESHNKLVEVSNSILRSNCDETYDHLQNLFNEVCPQDWRVCYMFLSTVGPKRLIITRLQADKEPIVVSCLINDDESASSDEDDSDCDSVVCNLASTFADDPLEELSEIIRKSNDTMSIQSPQEWWTSRKALDKRMMKLIRRLEKRWLSCWKGILMGELQDEDDRDTMLNAAKDIQKVISDNLMLEIRLDIAMIFLETLIAEHSNQVSSIVKCAFEDVDAKSLRTVTRMIKNILLKRCKSLYGLKRGPMVLVMDEQLSSVPWETLEYLSNVPITRMPSLLHLLAQLRIRKNVLSNGVDPTSSFFVLNPRNDLPRTEKTFYKLFTEQRRWPGIAGRPPTADEYMKALTDYELYIYCGHGSGAEYLRNKLLQKLDCKAVSLLMGCSSGKLKKNGLYDASGTVMNYLYSSCPAAVANLWDVTDKDIDRFLQQLLTEWLDENRNSTIASCVTNARKACTLGLLVGGSPVVYGLPVRLKDLSP